MHNGVVISVRQQFLSPKLIIYVKFCNFISLNETCPPTKTRIKQRSLCDKHLMKLQLLSDLFFDVVCNNEP